MANFQQPAHRSPASPGERRSGSNAGSADDFGASKPLVASGLPVESTGVVHLINRNLKGVIGLLTGCGCGCGCCCMFMLLLLLLLSLSLLLLLLLLLLHVLSRLLSSAASSGGLLLFGNIRSIKRLSKWVISIALKYAPKVRVLLSNIQKKRTSQDFVKPAIWTDIVDT